MINQPEIATADELVGALDALDVPFLTGGVQNETALALAPAALLIGLAQASEARVRSAIIPLLLRHPEFAGDARIAAARLQEQAQYTLELFYTAAMLLQIKYNARVARLFGVQAVLPDWFSETLAVEVEGDIEEALARVGERHGELQELPLNWTGSYEHAAQTWLDYMELRVKWGRTWQTT